MEEDKPKRPHGDAVAGIGDTGRTDLLGGVRVPKDHPRIELLGALDELSAWLALARAMAGADVPAGPIDELAEMVCRASSELACADAAAHEKLAPGLGQTEMERLERMIDEARAQMTVRPAFLRPARPGGAALHVARAVARRAERRLVSLQRSQEIFNPVLPAFVNRLADALFALTCLAESRGEHADG